MKKRETVWQSRAHRRCFGICTVCLSLYIAYTTYLSQSGFLTGGVKTVASLCVFGYELDLTKLSAEERGMLAKQIVSYREIEELVLGGDTYRLARMKEDGMFAMSLVSKEKDRAYVAGITGQTEANALQRRLKVQGLDDARMYRIRETNTLASGRALRTVGVLLPQLKEDFMPIEMHIAAEM